MVVEKLKRAREAKIGRVTGSLAKTLARTSSPRTSPTAEHRLIRGDAAGSLRVPGPTITSGQTIHKATELRPEEEGGKASGKISSVGVVRWTGGLDGWMLLAGWSRRHQSAL